MRTRCVSDQGCCDDHEGWSGEQGSKFLNEAERPVRDNELLAVLRVSQVRVRSMEDGNLCLRNGLGIEMGSVGILKVLFEDRSHSEVLSMPHPEALSMHRQGECIGIIRKGQGFACSRSESVHGLCEWSVQTCAREGNAELFMKSCIRVTPMRIITEEPMPASHCTRECRAARFVEETLLKLQRLA